MSIRSFFEKDMPSPAKPYDNEPGGPPRRICIVCGRKYVPIAGKDSPCGHTKANGTLEI